MAEAGFDDILISYNIMGEEKIAPARPRCCRPRTHARSRPTTRSTVAGLPEAAAHRRARPRRSWSNATPAASAPASRRPARRSALASDIAAGPGLAFAGFMLYPPENAHGARRSPSSTRRSRACGRPGSSRASSRRAARRTSPISASSRASTEHRAGTYVFNDRMMMARRRGDASTIARCTVSRPWSAGPRPSAASSMRAPRR